MAYFITGGTGFIGRNFIDKLKDREGDIYVLTRAASMHKFEELQERMGEQSDRLIPVQGDLTEKLLGVDEATIADLKGKIKYFCHFAAIYDIGASAEAQTETNIEGTRNAIQLAEAVEAGCFDECQVPWRVYRPGMVVGNSKTGEIDKIDGAYYFFKTLQKIRGVLPPWFPLVGIEGGKFNIVPVDYVVDAMDHIVHQDDLEGRCFHLTDPEHHSIGNMMNIFAEAGHAPRFSMRLDMRMFSFIPSFVRTTLAGLPPVKRIVSTLLEDMGLPDSVMMFMNYPTRYDNRDTERALKGSGISCPDLRDYAPVIWDYWERNLDPDLFVDHSLEGNVGGKIVLITGASSGIGKTSALRLAEAGAHVLLVARSADKLEETAAEIAELGGMASIYQADASDLEDCDRLIAEVLENHGFVDILINNAGRSIRRSLELSYDRFHDFERTMQINYFGAVRLTMGLLPSMSEQKKGHVINMSSISALTPSPRFSAYVASKSALDAWTRAAAVEYSDRNVRFTTINMPLVRTPMIEATTVYDSMPVLTPDEAADMVVDAVVNKPKRIATQMGVFLQVMTAVAPKFSEVMMNTVFRMFGDSAAAKGEKKPEKVEVSNEQVALASLMKGVHF
jgi:short-subunit dehydrogenase